jgi:hypothetical protein
MVQKFSAYASKTQSWLMSEIVRTSYHKKLFIIDEKPNLVIS